jgi:hypothetical protein
MATDLGPYFVGAVLLYVDWRVSIAAREKRFAEDQERAQIRALLKEAYRSPLDQEG